MNIGGGRRMTLVSIGMPAYNAEAHISEAIDAILCQDHAEFQLVISDNASSDRTLAICTDFAERDSRVTVAQQPRNLGPVANFRDVYSRVSTRYFMWAAADDRISINYVSALLAALKNHPEARLACGTTIYTDLNGAESSSQLPLAPPSNELQHLQALDLVLHKPSGSWLYGLWDRECTGELFSSLWDVHPWGGEIAFLHQVSLRHRIVSDPCAILYKRQNVPMIWRPRTSEELVRHQVWMGRTLMSQALSAPVGWKGRAMASWRTLQYLWRRFFEAGAAKFIRIWLRGILELTGIVVARAR